MSVTSNLYPPIIPDAMPAFVRTSACKVYFSLSIYNAAADIANVQISLTNQKTNKSALKNSLYPSGIKIANLSYDNTVQDDYKYYVQINTTDLEEGQFGLNQFYNVQLRFTSTNAPSPPSSGTGIATWLYENIEYFSEWSTICLIKGIEQPHIAMNILNSSSSTTLFVIPSEFTGKLYYQQNANLEKEVLKSFNLNIYKTSNHQYVVQSGEVYTNQFNPNEFYYGLSQDLQKQVNYTLEFNYTTNNLYKGTANFLFTISAQAENDLHAEIEAIPQEDNGRIKISISFDNYNTNKNLIIKRSSAKNNFNQWETLKTINHNNDARHVWYDTTIESGIWYKYRVQEQAEIGKVSDTENPVICVFEDIFLTNGKTQLKIQFNPNISDFRYNIPESQQNTLGATYPYIKRNGNNYYKSFSFSGLISSLTDDDNWYNPHYENGEFLQEDKIEPFTTPEQLYGATAATLYENYNEENDIDYHQDYIYEREFRQKVMDFLYANDVKIFRSLTEGNILVKLMNITLTPVTQLGRLLYSVSANAVEIDKNTFDNLFKYNLINENYYTYATQGG